MRLMAEVYELEAVAKICGFEARGLVHGHEAHGSGM